MISQELKSLNVESEQYFYNGSKVSKSLNTLNEELRHNYHLLEDLSFLKTERDLKKLKTINKKISELIDKIEEENELEELRRIGQTFNYDKLRFKYEKKNLKKKFPKFNLDKYFELLQNPINQIVNWKGENIIFDEYWVKKNLIALNQMVFDEMDIYILNIGKEGAGKSAWSSQQILWYYTVLSMVGLIDYAYDIKMMFFIDIGGFLQSNQEQGKNDYFRIKCMDEGNQLNRSNFRDEDNQQFKYEMRTERKLLRIIMINMQQIGELDTSISLSRVNFIYDCKMNNSKSTGTLIKGKIDMYIIPRGEEIYSDEYKKVFNRNEILNEFSKRLDKKKDYYIGLPKKYVVKRMIFDDAWGFDKEEYDDFVKDKMTERRFQKKQNLSDEIAFVLLNKLSYWKDLKSFDLSNASDKKMYMTLAKFFERMKKYFDANPSKYDMIKNHYYPQK